MINALAAQHIRNENTIVMLTCQVGSDFLNSNAAALVRNLRAHDRTIGEYEIVACETSKC